MVLTVMPPEPSPFPVCHIARDSEATVEWAHGFINWLRNNID